MMYLSNSLFPAIIIIVIILILIIVFSVISFANSLHRKIVKENSRKLQVLDSINQEYIKKFFVIEKQKEYNYTCLSRKEYNNFDFYKSLRTILSNNYDQYVVLLSKISYNDVEFKCYQDEYRNCANIVSRKEEIEHLHISFNKFQEIEKEIYLQNKLNVPCIKIKIKISIRYISPQGRVDISNSFTFDFEFIKKIMNELKEKREIGVTECSCSNKQVKNSYSKSMTKIQVEKEKLQKEKEKFQREKEELNRLREKYIYESEVQEKEIIIDDTYSKTEKLKQLKNLFDEGIISRDKYENERSRIISGK